MEKIRLVIYWSPGQEIRMSEVTTCVMEVICSFKNLECNVEVVLLEPGRDCCEETAVRERVFGTPSIKINGIDVEQDLMMYESHGLWDRKYMLAGQEILSPTTSAIKTALIGALARQRFAAHSPV